MNPRHRSRRRFLTAALAGPALGLAACADTDTPSVADTPFTLLDGSKSSTGQLKGHVTLVNFWATSCTTCVKEMPEIASTYQAFKARGFETLAVAMSYDPPAYVMAFASSRALPFKVTMDHDGALARNFGQVEITPTTFLLDKQGRIVKRYVGKPDFQAMRQLIDKLLQA